MPGSNWEYVNFICTLCKEKIETNTDDQFSDLHNHLQKRHPTEFALVWSRYFKREAKV